MPARAIDQDAASPIADFEVVTTSADATHADLRISGEITDRTVPLLLSVVNAHLRVGRSDLSLVLSDAAPAAPAGDASLDRVRSFVAGRSGRLTIVPAGAPVALAGVAG